MQKSQTNKILETEKKPQPITSSKMSHQQSQKILMQNQIVKEDTKSFIQQDFKSSPRKSKKVPDLQLNKIILNDDAKKQDTPKIENVQIVTPKKFVPDIKPISFQSQTPDKKTPQKEEEKTS